MAQSFELAYKTNLNGQSGGLPPEPHPLPQSQQSYGQLVGFPQNTLPPPLSNGQPAPCAPTPYLGPYADPRSQVRKAVRATQACNHCRSRKQKCDEARPCQFCRENNFDCQYKDVPPPKQDRSMMKLQERVDGVGEDVSNIVKMVERILTLIPSGEPNTSTPIKQEHMLVVTPEPATPVDSVRTDYSGTNGSRENVGLQSDHTTPAHMLLETWPSTLLFIVGIEYLKKLKENNQKVSDYAMQLEQDRGLLRIWGVGEEPENPEGSIYSNASSPALGKDDHPPSDHSKSSTTNGSSYQDSTEFEGGLGPDGRPDFDFQVLQQLYDSYMQNMHSLHPFLNPTEIHTMVEEFGEHVNAMPTGRPGVKRKRSTSHLGEPHLLGSAIERSLRNAIVLLILAIGKVCSYKGKVLPAPQIDSSATTKGTWGCTRDFSRRNTSFDNEPSENRLKNIEILPGMAYFAYAMDILGYQHGGNTAAHAQAMILAALYLSQYSRVLESWSWIESACRVTELLIKADYDKLHRDIYPYIKASLSSSERRRLNLIMRIYWTCVQLESDIRAELATLPASGASRYQGDIMYPEDVFEEEEETFMMMYSSQIWLRVILNESQNALYGGGGHKSFDTSNFREVAEYARSHVDVLERWRRVLPLVLAWNDEDPPATDLNIARLRAKYYGGLYVILRPYLRIAIDIFEPSSQQNSPAATADLTEDQRKVIEVACQCIDAAIRSTIAFDRVGAEPDSPYGEFWSTRTKRLVVTNIFGTLHAQFGNILVLTAVARSPFRQYLPSGTKLTKPNLTALIARTIGVLSEGAPNSPTLKMDLEILENIWRQQKSYW